MPKSSTASCTPSCLKLSELGRSSPSVSCIITCSVISSISASGARPDCSSASLTSSISSVMRELVWRRGSTLIVLLGLVRVARAATGVPDGMACWSTQRPIGRIRPVSSASGMNSHRSHQAALGVSPAHQRLDAGHAAGGDVDDRLVVEAELVALERRGEARPPGPAARIALRCMSGLNTTDRALPLPLAVYIAASALRSSSSAPPIDSLLSLMPTLTVTNTSLSSTTNGRRTRLADRGRHPARRPWTPRAGSRTRRRPAARRCRRCAGICGCARPSSVRSWSPAEWPRLSLTVLKSSTSRNSTATGSSARRAARARARRGRGTARGWPGRSAGRGTPGG